MASTTVQPNSHVVLTGLRQMRMLRNGASNQASSVLETPGANPEDMGDVRACTVHAPCEHVVNMHCERKQTPRGHGRGGRGSLLSIEHMLLALLAPRGSLLGFRELGGTPAVWPFSHTQ